MPDIPRFPAFDVTASLNKELIFNQTAGFGDPLAGTGSSIPKSLLVQEVIQNSNGTWSEIKYNKESPIKSQNDIITGFNQNRDSTIKSYNELASVYDTEMLKFNTQINQKKAEIISLVTTAVSAGCSTKSPSGPGVAATMFVPGADNIGGVACGIGSTIKEDLASIKIYSNISNYSAETPYDPISQENLSISNLGNGFENFVSNNSGSIVGSNYKNISTNPADHPGTLLDPLTPSEQAACAGYGSSILTLASEIEDLRDQRDQYISQVNNLKELKTGEEFLKWSSKQADVNLESYNNKLRNAITSIAQYTDNIITNGLVAYYDSAQTYGIEYDLESATNINAITKWNNLTGDGLYASPQTTVYQINLDLNDGPSVELNNYLTTTNQYFTIQSSFINSEKIISGDTSYTIETWIKITKDTNLGISSTTNGANIVGINSVHGYGLQVYKPSGVRVSFGERGSGGLTNNTNLNTNTWYHLLATNEASVGSKIYLNGSLDGNGSPINIISSTSNLQVGYASTQIDQYFSGKISLVRIYNKKFTQEEVTQNFNANKARYGY